MSNGEDIKEFLKGGYIKADEVQKGDVAVIIEPPTLVEKEFNQRKRQVLEGKVEYKGSWRILSWNKTNASTCADEWGEHTKAWLGKVVELLPIKVNVQGQLKDSICITPRKEPVEELKVEQPGWMTEEMIQGKIDFCQGLISREAAVKILLKENETKEKV